MMFQLKPTFDISNHSVLSGMADGEVGVPGLLQERDPGLVERRYSEAPQNSGLRRSLDCETLYRGLGAKLL